MLVKIKLEDGSYLYRNITRSNLRKMAKSIHSHFKYTDYPSLEGVIFNALQKEMTLLILNPPIAQEEEQATMLPSSNGRTGNL